MKQRVIGALLLSGTLLLNGCGGKSGSETPSSAAEHTSGTSAATTAPATTAVTAATAAPEAGSEETAGYLGGAGEMKFPASEKDEKNGMLFRFTGISPEECTVTWDAYRITDFTNGIGRGVTVNDSLYGNRNCRYVPIQGAGGVIGYTLEGITIKRNETGKFSEYSLAVMTENGAAQLVCRSADGIQKPLTAFAPEMNEYEWVSLASALEIGDSETSSIELFEMKGNMLAMNGSLFGSPQEELEMRFGYPIGALQPFNGWSVPLQSADITYNNINLKLLFRDGTLTSVYTESFVGEDLTTFRMAAADAVTVYGNAASVTTDKNKQPVQSWYVPEQNITLYLYTEYSEELQGYVFRQQYTVGETERYCGF